VDSISNLITDTKCVQSFMEPVKFYKRQMIENYTLQEEDVSDLSICANQQFRSEF